MFYAAVTFGAYKLIVAIRLVERCLRGKSRYIRGAHLIAPFQLDKLSGHSGRQFRHQHENFSVAHRPAHPFIQRHSII